MNIENLKQAREAAHFTQMQAAQALEISDGTYKNYEQGKREPNNAILLKIADLYGVTTDYLLGRESKQEPEIDYAEVKEKTEALIDRIEHLPPKYQDIMFKIMNMLHEVDHNVPQSEIRQSSMEYVGTIGEQLAERQQAEAEAEALRKDTA